MPIPISIAKAGEAVERLFGTSSTTHTSAIPRMCASTIRRKILFLLRLLILVLAVLLVVGEILLMKYHLPFVYLFARSHMFLALAHLRTRPCVRATFIYLRIHLFALRCVHFVFFCVIE